MSRKQEPMRCVACKQIPDLTTLVPKGGQNNMLCASCKEKGFTTAMGASGVVAVPPKMAK